MALVPFPGATAPDANRDDEAVGPYASNSAAPVTASPAPPPEEDEEPPEGRMTFLEHLDELRKRITHAVLALLAGFLIAFAFIDPVWNFVFARLTADIPGGDLIYTEPSE